jgi:hypothetical protein
MIRTLVTKDGPVDLEDYVAAVVTAENGTAAVPAVQAQAVAARTYVLRAMRDDPALGTAKKPISSSERFQVYAPHAGQRATQATKDTAGIVCRYMGELIICNYVAGALWSAAGKTAEDPTHTEKFVTYNDGKTGADVKPSPISNKSRPDNRGCKSQNGADWLGRHGYEYPAILRYFYGADLEIGPLDRPAEPSAPLPPEAPRPAPTPTTGSASSPVPVLAALALTLLGGNRT